MLAAHHEQENIYTHHAGTTKQQLQAKTPGARFPKTPLKVPLNDENVQNGFSGKSGLRTKGNNENTATVMKGGNGLGKAGKSNLVTPAGPQTGRAPLGNKTTNAKARPTQPSVGVKEIIRDFEKTSLKPTTTVRPRHTAPQFESSKLEVHTDNDPLDEEEDVEYAPPKLQDPPYESDVFPDGVLTYNGMKPENLFKGYYDYYFNQTDENGMTAQDRRMEESQQRTFLRGEEQILRDMEEFDWSVGDVPDSKGLFKVKRDTDALTSVIQPKKATALIPRPPNTINSRKAAAALGMSENSQNAKASKPIKPIIPTSKARSFLMSQIKAAQPVIQPTIAPRERTTGIVASRSTLGYSKGRSALSASHQPEPVVKKPRALSRTASTTSSSSDSTITPARFAQKQASKDWKRPGFMSIFDVDEVANAQVATIPEPEASDDEFQLSTNF